MLFFSVRLYGNAWLTRLINKKEIKEFSRLAYAHGREQNPDEKGRVGLLMRVEDRIEIKLKF